MEEEAEGGSSDGEDELVSQFASLVSWVVGPDHESAGKAGIKLKWSYSKYLIASECIMHTNQTRYAKHCQLPHRLCYRLAILFSGADKTQCAVVFSQFSEERSLKKKNFLLCLQEWSCKVVLHNRPCDTHAGFGAHPTSFSFSAYIEEFLFDRAVTRKTIVC